MEDCATEVSGGSPKSGLELGGDIKAGVVWHGGWWVVGGLQIGTLDLVFSGSEFWINGDGIEFKTRGLSKD